jgi:hypothetical protein
MTNLRDEYADLPIAAYLPQSGLTVGPAVPHLAVESTVGGASSCAPAAEGACVLPVQLKQDQTGRSRWQRDCGAA